MKVYEIDTECLEAKKGATIIRMVSVEDIKGILWSRKYPLELRVNKLLMLLEESNIKGKDDDRDEIEK